MDDYDDFRKKSDDSDLKIYLKEIVGLALYWHFKRKTREIDAKKNVTNLDVSVDHINKDRRIKNSPKLQLRGRLQARVCDRISKRKNK